LTPIAAGPRPVRQGVAGRIDVTTNLRNRAERGEPEGVGPSHFGARCDAVRVRIEPHRQLRPDRVGARDHAVIITAQQRLIVLRQADEAIGRGTAFQQRRADAEELRAIVDQTVAVTVERQKRLVTAPLDPLHVLGEPIPVDVEGHAAACGTHFDAIATRVDDDRAALSPDLGREQA
jgi:hypothetical protein